MKDPLAPRHSQLKDPVLPTLRTLRVGPGTGPGTLQGGRQGMTTAEEVPTCTQRSTPEVSGTSSSSQNT